MWGQAVSGDTGAPKGLQCGCLLGTSSGGKGCRVHSSALLASVGQGGLNPGGLQAQGWGDWPRWNFYGNPGTEWGGIAQTICSSPTYETR